MPEEIDFKLIDGMWIKQIHLEGKGQLVPQHVHQWDHSTLLAKGSVVLWIDGAPSYHNAPEVLFIEAGKIHEFQTLSDEVLLYCLHNLHGEEQIAVLAQHDLREDDLKLGVL